MAVANGINEGHFEDQGFHLSFSGNSSQRKLVMDYEMRKKEQMEHEKQIREQIRQQIGLTQDPWKMSGAGPFRTPTKSQAAFDTENVPITNTLGCTSFDTGADDQ